MLVLHGFWSTSNGLCLWAEDSTLPVTSPAPRCVRHARIRSPRPPMPSPRSTPASRVLRFSCCRRCGSHRSTPGAVPGYAAPGTANRARSAAGDIPVMLLPAASALTALGEPAADVRYGASVGSRRPCGLRAGVWWQRGRVLPALVQRRTRASRVLASGGARSRLVRPELVDRRDATGMPGRVGCPGRPTSWPPRRPVCHSRMRGSSERRLPAGIGPPPARRGRRPKHVPAQKPG